MPCCPDMDSFSGLTILRFGDTPLYPNPERNEMMSWTLKFAVEFDIINFFD
jgi:hypothetical protein